MTTSGTKTFTMAVDDIVKEAAERIGGNPISGDEAESARVSLNLLFLYLISKSAPLNAQEQNTFPTVASQAEYALDEDIVNVQTCAVVDGTNEYELNREDIKEYVTSYQKDKTGRPTTYFLRRTKNGLYMTLWPKPDKVYTMRMWNTTRLEDITKATETLDIPAIYYPAICSGLTYYMSLKRKDVDTNLRNEIKMLFNEELKSALEEDRTRMDMIIVPQGK